jgi:hypothetical protein
MTPEERLQKIQMFDRKIEVFASLLQDRMRVNVIKPSWENDPPAKYMLLLIKSVGHLSSLLLDSSIEGDTGVMNAAADVANYAWILLDLLFPTYFQSDITEEP